jgi:hypothetical protein
MIKKNKKASWFVDNLGQMILMAIGIAVAFYFIWAYILHGGAPAIAQLQQCGSLTGNNGECKETCDKNLEYEFPDIGCKGLENKCCVPKEESINDLNLPSGYGGNTEYDFSIKSFEIDIDNVPSECTTSSSDSTVIGCPQNSNINLPVKVEAINIGTGEIEVYVAPMIIIGGDSNKLSIANLETPIDKKTIAGKVSGSSASEEVILATIKITTTESNSEEKYLEIYPYLICSTDNCKKTDSSKNRGIKVTDSSKIIRVKFVSN